ncbi:hypothetical protein KW834_03180 [Pseudomonas sp. PDM29]|uniref:hypothetical protein n=1 Tax=Pseudomonas sp. PDM29 TaxID=2854771 RepID=UPI001C484C83|nr:hypothetical protein [Pseudomonas sp. PDM29]MBV7523409.1 hypothetical protein [Pseudomonas sp. PDM29]
MKRSDILLMVAGGTGLFMAGVVWRPAFGNYANLKDALECTSFLATIVAALVAIYTLRAWKDQFRHAERFAALRALKDAITDLHLYRGYLLSVIGVFNHLRASGGVPDQTLINEEKEKKEKLLLAFSAYRKAWVAAVPFFTPREESEFPGSPDSFMTLYLSRVQQLHDAHKKYSKPEQSAEFQAIADYYNNEAMDLFKKTADEIQLMLRKKV